MKRELATLGVTLVFALFLAGTSRRRVPVTTTTTTTTITPTAGAPATVALPDTSSWKPYTSPAAKLQAKTPPGATVACTKTGHTTVCTVSRGMKIFAFGRGGRTVSEMASDIRKKNPETATVLYDTPDALIVHRSDPALGEYCELVTSSAPKLTSVFAHQDGIGPGRVQVDRPARSGLPRHRSVRRHARVDAVSHVVSAALALALGVLVYLCWRTGLQVHRVPFAAELAMFGAAHPVPPWVKGSLPDALWQYAYTAIVAELWRDEPWPGRKLVFVGAPALAGVVIEMLQRVHVFPGTFDWMETSCCRSEQAPSRSCLFGHGFEASLPAPR